MAIREGAWDCPHCGRKRNRGPEKFCGGCGAPRGDDVPFYLPDDAREVTEADELRRAQAGPDWTCAFCEADNPSDHAFCSSCGASRDGSTARPVVEHRDDAVPPAPLAATAPETPPPASPAPGSHRLKRGCQIGCLALVALVFLFWLIGRPRERDLTVTGHRWERTVAVEELRTVTEDGWEGELPAGARSLSSRREVHHQNRIRIGTERRTRTVSERVQTGTQRKKVGSRDMGNGYFEDIYEDQPVYQDRQHEETYEEPVYREEPEYRLKHHYEIDKWMPAREAKAGAADLSPVWPDPDLGPKQREGKRTEVYEVLFDDREGDSRVYRARDELEWKSFQPGAAYRAKVNVRSGEVVEILGPT